MQLCAARVCGSAQHAFAAVTDSLKKGRQLPLGIFRAEVLQTIGKPPMDHPLTAGQKAMLGMSKASGSARNGGSGNGTDPHANARPTHKWKAPPPLPPPRVLSDEEQRQETADRHAEEARRDRMHRISYQAHQWRRSELGCREMEEARIGERAMGFVPGTLDSAMGLTFVVNPQRAQFVPLHAWPRTSPQDTRPRDDNMWIWDDAYGSHWPLFSTLRNCRWQRMIELSVNGLQFDLQCPESLRREIHRRTRSCVEGNAYVTQYLADCYEALQRNQRAMDEIAARRHLIRVHLDMSQVEDHICRTDRIMKGRVAVHAFLACVQTTAIVAKWESGLTQLVEWDHTYGTAHAVEYVHEHVREPIVAADFIRHQAAYMASRTKALGAHKELDDTRRWLGYNAHMNAQFMDQRHEVYTSFCDACVTFTSVAWHVDEGSGLRRTLVPFLRCTCGNCFPPIRAAVLLDHPTAAPDVVDRQDFIDSVALVPSLYRSDWASDPEDTYMDWIRAPTTDSSHSDSTAIPGSASLSRSVSRESDFPMIPSREPSL